MICYSTEPTSGRLSPIFQVLALADIQVRAMKPFNPFITAVKTFLFRWLFGQTSRTNCRCYLLVIIVTILSEKLAQWLLLPRENQCQFFYAFSSFFNLQKHQIVTEYL